MSNIRVSKAILMWFAALGFFSALMLWKAVDGWRHYRIQNVDTMELSRRVTKGDIARDTILAAACHVALITLRTYLRRNIQFASFGTKELWLILSLSYLAGTAAGVAILVSQL